MWMTSPAALSAAIRDPAAETAFARLLAGSRLGRPVRAFAAAGSTMDVAHAWAAGGAPEGALVVAARQEQGRGRLGRTWLSPEGGLYCSLILRPQRPAAEVPQLSLVAGLAAAEAVRDAAGVYPSIRWPNDLLVRNRKLAGILTEARGGAVVVGLGINIAADPAQLPDGATSLAAESAGHVSREDVLARLCGRLSAWYDTWSSQGFAPVREALRPWIGLFGQPVHLTSGTQRLEGVAQDVDAQGRFVVRLEAGIVRAFDMGEVALLRGASCE